MNGDIPDDRLTAKRLAGGGTGWRLVFPLGTMPVPFHPGIALALPILTLAALFYVVGGYALSLAGAAEAPRWRELLLAAGLLAIPLSLPLVQWMAYVFRLFLLQALLIFGAVVLIAIAVAKGDEPLWMAAIPVAFFGWHAFSAIAGRLVIRANARRAAALAAAPPFDDPASTPIALEAAGTQSFLALDLLERFDLPVIYTYKSVRAKEPARWFTAHRVSREEFESIRAELEQLHASWSAEGSRKDRIALLLPCDGPPRSALRLRIEQRRLPGLKGRLTRIIAKHGDKGAALMTGRAGMVVPIPVFTAFIHVSIFNGGGRATFQRQIGFVHGREVEVGPSFYDAIESLFANDQRALPPEPDLGARAIQDALAPIREAERQTEHAMLAALIADPQNWGSAEQQKRKMFPLLTADSHCYAEHADSLVSAMETLKAIEVEERHLHKSLNVHALANLVSHLPPREFAGVGPRLIVLLNSRKLAASWNVRQTPDQVKRGIVPFDGHALLHHAPQLYARLGELGEPARPLIMVLGEAFGWPAPLIAAREALG